MVIDKHLLPRVLRVSVFCETSGCRGTQGERVPNRTIDTVLTSLPGTDFYQEAEPTRAIGPELSARSRVRRSM